MSDAARFSFAPELCHDPLVAKAPRMLRFDPEAFFPEWQSGVRRTFKQLLGPMPAPVPLDVHIEFERDAGESHETRFVFTSEPGAQVPCHLLMPKGVRGPVPLIICLQGHGPGMHLSLGRPADDAERAMMLRAITITRFKPFARAMPR